MYYSRTIQLNSASRQLMEYLSTISGTRRLTVDKVPALFKAIARDYLSGLLSTRVFSTLVAHIYFYSLLTDEIDRAYPSLSKLLHVCADLDWLEAQGKAQETVKEIEAFISPLVP